MLLVITIVRKFAEKTYKSKEVIVFTLGGIWDASTGTFCVCLTSTDPTCSLYGNYAGQILVTDSGREHNIWRNQQSEHGQYAQNLGKSPRASTTVDSSSVAWFSGTISKGAARWDRRCRPITSTSHRLS